MYKVQYLIEYTIFRNASDPSGYCYSSYCYTALDIQDIPKALEDRFLKFNPGKIFKSLTIQSIEFISGGHIL